MDAMIFAAGLGTRLEPLTHTIPKALVEIGGTPMLEHIARRLVEAGADRLIINTHPHPGQIREFVDRRDGFGVEVVFSHEPERPLDTAGGLLHAAPLFRRNAPFFIHNCDVLTDVDLRALYDAHCAAADRRLATLAVLPPSAERYLIFDDVGLIGYAPRGGGEAAHVRESHGATHRRDFTGIHVADPQLLDTLPPGAGSIVTHYLELSRTGTVIARHDQPDALWIDIGTHEKLAAARQLYASMSGRTGST